jgi:hypothetical protein
VADGIAFSLTGSEEELTEMRPHSLAEVVTVAGAGNREEFGMACDEFCDAFYLSYPEKAGMQAHLDPVPEATGDPEKDAWIGAIGEHLALRWRLKVPKWTTRPIHFALSAPVFMPPSMALRPSLIAESPSAFRSRLIFTMAEPLKRARFPDGVELVRMPWKASAPIRPLW